MHIRIGKKGITLIHKYVVRRLVAIDGFNYVGMIQGSVDRANTTIEGKELFPEIQDKAGSILYSMVRFHPFADGCKRTGLLTAYLYLLYNGYRLSIPPDSARFLQRVAELESQNAPNEKDVINWIKKHSRKSFSCRIINFWLSIFTWLGLDIGEYSKVLLEMEVLPNGITKDFKDTELEKALAKHKI